MSKRALLNLLVVVAVILSGILVTLSTRVARANSTNIVISQLYGGNTVVVFDGRSANYSLGTNGALSVSYVLLDTSVEGDALMP